ncbi:hypothetical protein HPMG_01097 [Helicobacter pullorum MIT 98-5489]|uniref:Uncharacterized protein n=1 Tax=Helicobacter pullorum MIT 98-5489 TaxID=537972 RepID=C5F046_9HELI|nr:hypothetical protein HPMG_01097 [Helicobacter pullorum MIT 98-5489]
MVAPKATLLQSNKNAKGFCVLINSLFEKIIFMVFENVTKGGGRILFFCKIPKNYGGLEE